MHFIKDFKPTPQNILKLAGVLIIALIVLALAAQMFAPSLPLSIAPHGPMLGGYGMGVSTGGSAGYDGNYAKSDESYSYASDDSAALSPRNAIAAMPGSTMMPPSYPQSQGPDAEKYEVTQYSASIETRDREGTCNSITAIKSKDYVIFENSNAYDRGCSYTFKVERAHVDEILSWLKGLDPKYLNENTYTIQKQVNDYMSEEAILKSKLTEINSTLASATNAYDDVTVLATQTRDASSLASIISSRIEIISRLTQEKLNINEQLDRLARAKADSMDGLIYTRFSVEVSESTFVDAQQIKDSWMMATHELVRVINDAIQGVTINLIALFFLVLQYALYALILLVIAKYGWYYATRIWKS